MKHVLRTEVPDVKLQYGDELVYLHPKTEAGLSWMLGYTTDPQAWYGRSMAVDRNRVQATIESMLIAGLKIH